MLTFLSVSTTCRTISGLARDAVIELITRNIHYTTLDWAERFVEIGGIQRLLEVASELKEYKYESAIPITDSSRTLSSVCLARVYENMYYDQAKERYLKNVDEFVKEKLLSPDIESKVRVIVTITTLLLGALDVGNTLVAREGIMEMILVMAGTDDELQQVSWLVLIRILFLVNPAKDEDMRRWAAEGLSYLTLDADVKEQLIEDKKALHALFDLAREVLPEMLELAKFAKQHIPEEHELDDPDFVAKRVDTLAKEGVTTALVSLARTESPNSRELIARVFNALCGQQEVRGIVSAQGGAKALISLSLEGTDKGKKQAAQALARIGITTNPEVCFPGQRCLEVIRPLVMLLHPDCSALESFEALMALCNLASVSESVRKRIVKEQGLQRIEVYLYDEHELLKRAANQCIVNLMLSPEFLVLLSSDEDEETHKAASGALAIFLSSSPKSCNKVFDTNQWTESLRFLLANPNPDVQHRGVVILHCVMTSSKENASKIVETDLFEILMAIGQLEDADKQKIRKIAMECLQQAEKWKLIAKPDPNAPTTSVEQQSEDLGPMPDLLEVEDNLE
ncbi:hypothetical protein B566_EDAN006506 [Ephemera danica]|nr:hypothetical protein B566_EDAN006506 [Ephemera danica]